MIQGQYLMRQALEAHTLEPVLDVLGAVSPATPQLELANTLKAVRFGLAGIAIY